jgi:hypothetical protein
MVKDLEVHYFLPLYLFPIKIVGVAEEGDALFPGIVLGMFIIFLESLKVKKVHETDDDMKIVYPYAPSMCHQLVIMCTSILLFLCMLLESTCSKVALTFPNYLNFATMTCS